MPGMNEFIAAQNRNRFIGAKMKKDYQLLAKLYLQKQIQWQIEKPVFISYYFFEENKRRDHDNVSGFAHKVIQDALVEAGILKDDGWDEVFGYSDRFEVDKKRPRIEVVITEVED
jgi:Holliday junction resolvase RusA-like endonuclease